MLLSIDAFQLIWPSYVRLKSKIRVSWKISYGKVVQPTFYLIFRDKVMLLRLLAWNLGRTVDDGEDNIESSCPLWPEQHPCYSGQDKRLWACEGELTPKTHHQFGLQAASHLQVAEIASNRQSAIHRWIRSRDSYTLFHLAYKDFEITFEIGKCVLSIILCIRVNWHFKSRLHLLRGKWIVWKIISLKWSLI